MEGYKKALADRHFKNNQPDILFCGNDIDENFSLIKKALKKNKRPDGIIACVEKFTSSIYLVCNELKLSIPGDIKVISFTNLQTALILNPPLTTVTQPAFEMGKTAASVLFKTLGKNSTTLKNETVIIPSILNIRYSSS